MNQKTSPEINTQSINIISQGTRITGDIVSDGDIRIDGFLKGNIRSKGRLVVGGSGTIEGDVECVNVEVSGKVKGKIAATELITMKTSAMVTGEISTAKLSVEPGSVFSGTCKMGQDVQMSSPEPQ